MTVLVRLSFREHLFIFTSDVMDVPNARPISANLQRVVCVVCTILPITPKLLNILDQTQFLPRDAMHPRY